MKTEKSVGTILFFYKLKPHFLILKYNIYGQTHWDFIKGKPEKNETLKQTALREIKEESSIKDVKIIPSFKKVLKYSYNKNDGSKATRSVCYLIAGVNENFKDKVKIGKEHSKYKWVTYSQSLRYLKFPSQRKLIKEANNFLENSVTN